MKYSDNIASDVVIPVDDLEFGKETSWLGWCF
jgi:hypothetical protein